MKPAVRLAWIVLGGLALVVVAVIAYSIGVSNGHGTEGLGFMPFRDMGTFGYGWGWLGVLVPVLLIGAGVLFVLALVAEPRRGTPPAPPYPPTYPPPYEPGTPVPPVPDDGVARLRELADLHTQGHLTDEEFVVAKRKLLGM